MKKWLSMLLACLMLVSALPLSAMAAAGDPLPTVGTDADVSHFYYEYAKTLDNKYVQEVYEAYEAAADISEITLALPELEGLEEGSPEAQAILDSVTDGAQLGAWYYRYDHVAETELYTQTTQLSASLYTEREGSLSIPKFTGDCTLTVLMPLHAYADDDVQALRDQKVAEIAATVNKNASLYDQLFTVYEAVANLGTYDEDVVNNTTEESMAYLYAHTSLGLLLRGAGVCESYAKAFKLVCDYLEIPNVTLVSDNHMWNVVPIDGKWYAVDVTFGDQEWQSGPLIRYFLSIDPSKVVEDNGSDMPKDHQIKAGYPGVEYADEYYHVCRLAATELMVTGEANTNRLEFTDVRGADSYRIRRRQYTSQGWSSWSKLAEVQGMLYYHDTTMQKGITYEYEVVAGFKDLFYGEAATARIRNLASPSFTLENAVGGVSIRWNAVAGASSYTIIRYPINGNTVNTSNLTVVASGVGGTEYLDVSVRNNTSYAYTVQANHAYGDSLITNRKLIHFLSTPTCTVSNDASGINIQWSRITGVSTYYVYRYTYSGGKWVPTTQGGREVAIKSTTGTRYTDTGVRSGTSYLYMVRGYSNKGASARRSSASICRLSAPNVTVSNGTVGLTVKWGRVTGAKRYVVYRRQYNGRTWSGWSTITANASGTSYNDTTARNGVYYRYTVKAVNGNYASTFNSSANAYRLATPVVSAQNATSGMSVKWNRVSGAKQYVVYRSQYNGRSWSGWAAIRLYASNVSSFTDASAKNGIYYRYTVKAVNGGYTSAFVASSSVRRLATPTVRVYRSFLCLRASWGKNSAANRYIVYRRQYSGGRWSGWKAVKTTTATQYADFSVKRGVYYQYTVKAMSGSHASAFTASSKAKR